jgi:hypothetical protein
LVKFTPFLRASDYMQIKFECVCPTPLMFIWLRNLYYTFFSKYIIILLITFHLDIRGGGADTLKFNLHIIERAKKGCEFNQKRCEFKISLNYIYILFGTKVPKPPNHPHHLGWAYKEREVHPVDCPMAACLCKITHLFPSCMKGGKTPASSSWPLLFLFPFCKNQRNLESVLIDPINSGATLNPPYLHS